MNSHLLNKVSQYGTWNPLEKNLLQKQISGNLVKSIRVLITSCSCRKSRFWSGCGDTDRKWQTDSWKYSRSLFNPEAFSSISVLKMWFAEQINVESCDHLPKFSPTNKPGSSSFLPKGKHHSLNFLSESFSVVVEENKTWKKERILIRRGFRFPFQCFRCCSGGLKQFVLHCDETHDTHIWHNGRAVVSNCAVRQCCFETLCHETDC